MFLMLALNYAVSIDPFIEGAKNDIQFEELCIMKYAPSDIPALQQVQGAYNVPSSEEYLLLCYVYGITE